MSEDKPDQPESTPSPVLDVEGVGRPAPRATPSGPPKSAGTGAAAGPNGSAPSRPVSLEVAQSLRGAAARAAQVTASATAAASQRAREAFSAGGGSTALAPSPPAGGAVAPGPAPQTRVATAVASGTAVPGTPQVRRAGRVRKARLRLLRLDPWSVMKTSFLLSVAAGVTLFVAVAVLWSVLDAAGVFTSVGDVVRDLTASESSTGIEITEYVGLSRVLGLTTIIAVVDVVLVTALATLGAFLYNLSASLLGGLEITLAEDD